ncbi:PAAR domain-containing protein [Dyella caseinilytica]|uniref:PAAR domain-containing protein n=1 Tax=Dyella caseinilytica TaxID=1849581 RepID=A0ABX7GX75_9GAMM|nr:PAAR domain-containing protein [Dyella caseinilytica]QRN54915.1 PAAR domain-containing protein [Dyella caseinilytica]GFZ97889.1 hypothetical protein GCM10011408_18020 [Dyella caseinilytica]
MSNQECKGTMYAFATIGARTERGGYVTRTSSKLSILGFRAALVGDVVTYNDASEAAIIDGSGTRAHERNKCFALVGSRLSNGDRIVFTPWDNGKSGLFVAEGENPEGFFEPHYVPPATKPNYRFAIFGATTARGGVLLEPSRDWQIDGRAGKVATLGDIVQYADGTTARIITALSLQDSADFVPLAFVGSELDNGDTITDSPERKGEASSRFTIIRKEK